MGVLVVAFRHYKSCDRPGEGISEKNCCWWLTFGQHERKSQVNSEKWVCYLLRCSPSKGHSRSENFGKRHGRFYSNQYGKFKTLKSWPPNRPISDLSAGLWGITSEFVGFIPQSLVLRQPRSQGLSSYRPLGRARGGEMRDPGNEVGPEVCCFRQAMFL